MFSNRAKTFLERQHPNHLMPPCLLHLLRNKLHSLPIHGVRLQRYPPHLQCMVLQHQFQPLLMEHQARLPVVMIPRCKYQFNKAILTGVLLRIHTELPLLNRHLRSLQTHLVLQCLSNRHHLNSNNPFNSCTGNPQRNHHRFPINSSPSSQTRLVHLHQQQSPLRKITLLLRVLALHHRWRSMHRSQFQRRSPKQSSRSLRKHLRIQPSSQWVSSVTKHPL
mmetsp:Transcript_91767/g.179808  ORF Transcript_91767/g.179808 Transcript_91767/m.179808 type:complete len:221 (-) Transcript_91767:688-1350(-)